MKHIHKLVLPAVIEAAKQGATAADLMRYFDEACRGMQVNAAFKLKGDDLVAALEVEL